MSKFAVIVWEESKGKPSEPFLATRDPEVVRAVRRMIADRLRERRPAPPSQEKRAATETE